LEIFGKEFNEFSKAVKEGTAELYKKAEIGKKLPNKFYDFLELKPN